jgi:hypothetical protein
VLLCTEDLKEGVGFQTNREYREAGHATLIGTATWDGSTAGPV